MGVLQSEKQIEIKKVTIRMGEREVSISIPEAKRLQEVLNELFGKEVIKEILIKEYHHHHDHYPTYPYQPIWVYNDNKYLCGNGTVVRCMDSLMSMDIVTPGGLE